MPKSRTQGVSKRVIDFLEERRGEAVRVSDIAVYTGLTQDQVKKIIWRLRSRSAYYRVNLVSTGDGSYMLTAAEESALVKPEPKELPSGLPASYSFKQVAVVSKGILLESSYGELYLARKLEV